VLNGSDQVFKEIRDMGFESNIVSNGSGWRVLEYYCNEVAE
jgi:predicted type IV restriction endonuclease